MPLALLPGFLAEAELFFSRAMHETTICRPVADDFGCCSTLDDSAPKYRSIYLHALHTCVALHTRDGAVELHTIPLFHANGWGVPHCLMMMVGKHVMISHFHANEVFRLIETERVEAFKAVPAMATTLVNHPDRGTYDLTSLRQVFIGGAAASPTLIREVEETFACECYTLFGLTETCPVLSHAPAKPELHWDHEQRQVGQAKAGFAIPGAVLGIVDGDDHQQVGFGQQPSRHMEDAFRSSRVRPYA